MELKVRPAVSGDFDAFFHGLFGDDPTIRDLIHNEWRIFLDHSPNLTMIVEDMHREHLDRLVGIAQTVFVTNAYVEYMQSDVPPHANQHASAHLPDGSWPLLTLDQVRHANSTTGLNALTTRWGWRTEIGDFDLGRHLRIYMDRNYELYYRGYQYKYLLMPAYGEWACEHLMHAGYSLLTDYAEYLRENPPTNADDLHPYLLHVSRDTNDRREGNTVSRVFDYTPPRFYFKAHEQELLWEAVLGASDAEAADKLCVGRDAVKKRWESIYDRVRDVDSGLLPEGKEGTRGVEKRRLLLAYIREHLEEVRPCRDPHS